MLNNWPTKGASRNKEPVATACLRQHGTLSDALGCSCQPSTKPVRAVFTAQLVDEFAVFCTELFNFYMSPVASIKRVEKIVAFDELWLEIPRDVLPLRDAVSPPHYKFVFHCRFPF